MTLNFRVELPPQGWNLHPKGRHSVPNGRRDSNVTTLVGHGKFIGQSHLQALDEVCHVAVPNERHGAASPARARQPRPESAVLPTDAHQLLELFATEEQRDSKVWGLQGFRKFFFRGPL